MLGPQSQMDQKEHFQQASVIISVVVSHSQFCRITSNLTVLVWVVQIHIWVHPQFTGWYFSLLLIEQTQWGHKLNPPPPVMLLIMLYTAHTLRALYRLIQIISTMRQVLSWYPLYRWGVRSIWVQPTSYDLNLGILASESILWTTKLFRIFSHF